MRRVVSLWLPRFATDRRQRGRAPRWERQAENCPTSAGPAEASRVEDWELESWGVESCEAETARPLALVADQGGRLSLAAVNAEAEAGGLAPGLPLAEARALLPGLVTAPHEPEADARAIAALAAWCMRYTPWAAPCSTAEGQGLGPGGAAGVLLDVSGCCHLFGGEAALLEDLQARLTGFGFTARAALADTLGTAWAMARFATAPAHPCLVVLPGRQRAALAPLPPAALRLPQATVELMDRLGLRRIEDLYGLSPAVLTPRFGAQAVRRLAQALGSESEALSPRQPPAAYLTRRLFAEPVSDAEDIARATELLLERLCRELALAGRGARQLDLTAYRSDGSLQRIGVGTSRPSRDVRHLRRLFAEKLARIDPGFGIEVMTLGAALTAPLAAQQMDLGQMDLVQREPAGRERAEAGVPEGAGSIPELADRLGSRLGLGAVRTPRLRQSHLPERAFVLAPAGQEDERQESGGQKGGGAGANDDWQQTPHPKLRPLRLLARPEPVEAVSLLPDYPPARFRWRRVLHQVVRAEGPERLLGEWWRNDPEEGDAPPRDYFRVEDQDGRRYWLYRSAGRWFLHGLFG